ncbi:uncharacterized protein EV420DRAFT_168176 [Desarmillaria tabescens]|uniref:Secreted protein n=1 Tax=Armillaria tabescens TaxID=1929756 RepID=A0AA39N8F6_ARMTA|nr:uncharacterized protein EV420DRAFT_168176 [Desarmillaria tabescens]KAK0460955.1 hypothetical protein EV420DRAFT_168176 [Desarmillaria tabescens]
MVHVQRTIQVFCSCIVSIVLAAPRDSRSFVFTLNHRIGRAFAEIIKTKTQMPDHIILPFTYPHKLLHRNYA